MQEDPATEASAAQARERLVAFAGEMVGALRTRASARTRSSTCAGSSSTAAARACSPRCSASARTPRACESLQQFLADSPWDARLLARACAERVAPELGLAAWVIDGRRRRQGRAPLPPE